MIDFGVLLRDVFFGDYVHIYPFEIAVIEYTSSGYFWIVLLEACLSCSLHTRLKVPHLLPHTSP